MWIALALWYISGIMSACFVLKNEAEGVIWGWGDVLFIVGLGPVGLLYFWYCK